MALTKNIVLVALLALASIQGSQSQETPGTDCADDNPCNSAKFLICVAGKCECDTSRSLYFDLFKKTCTLKLDQVCVPETEGEPTCSTGGSCKQDADQYKCSCNDGYNPDGDTRCVKVVDYDQSCASDEEYLACREGLNVECNPTTRKCDCMGGYFVLADKSMCLAGFGTRCDSDPAGQPFSKCNPELFTECQASSGTCGCPTTHMIDSLVTPPACALRLDQPCGAAGTAHCFSDSECKGNEGSKKCECSGTLTPNSNKICQTPYDQDCTTVACNEDDFTECNAEKKCTCNEENQHIFDVGSAKCSIFAGGNCTGEPGEIACVSNSVCNDDKVCTCSNNFIESEKVCKNGGVKIMMGHVFVSFVGIVSFFAL